MQTLFSAFVSHSSKDDLFVERLVEALDSCGIHVWDDRQLRAGENWTQIAEGRIREARVTILVITSDAYKSSPVLKEILFTLNSGKPIVPILLKPLKNWKNWSSLKDYRDRTISLRDVTHINLTHWQSPEPLGKLDVQKLVDGINTYRVEWFRELLHRIDPTVALTAQAKVQEIENMIKMLGQNALPYLMRRLAFGVNDMYFEPPEASAVIAAVAEIGGDVAYGLLKLAFEAFHPLSKNMAAIITTLGYVGDLAVEASLNIRLADYKKDGIYPDQELARVTFNAINRIGVRRISAESGQNLQPRDI